MTMDRVFVTRRLPQPGLDLMATRAEVVVSPLKRDLTPTELIDRSAGARVLCPTLADKITPEYLDARPEIELVATFAVGFDNIDLDAAQKRGVVVTNTPGVLTGATADMTLALILAVMRRLVEGDKLLRAGRFEGVSPLFHLGADLEGKVLGIFGLGRIGQAVAERARPFGMKIIYHNRNRRPEAEERLGARYVSFEDLLAESDVISINAPANPETIGRFDYAAFSRTKKTAYIVNTGRGVIINEADLVRALQEGLIAGAGLDVYEQEPAVDPGLIGLDNVVLAPHLGSATIEVRDRMSLLVAESVVAFLDGREPPHRLV
ncbi:MAG: D-glycerate dehydrogenase [Proteobacteria bacterium]|nr:D-glycerate dehydrogenase [Pseudomonadota bacterium]